jgi:hypothetical protein
VLVLGGVPSPDTIKTTKVCVDVENAFAKEPDTAKSLVDERILAYCAEENPRDSDVDTLVPLDAVPALTVARSRVPWDEIGERAAQIVLRVDGEASAMEIVTGLDFAPSDAARELAQLARRGVVHLLPPRLANTEDPNDGAPALQGEPTSLG